MEPIRKEGFVISPITNPDNAGVALWLSKNGNMFLVDENLEQEDLETMLSEDTLKPYIERYEKDILAAPRKPDSDLLQEKIRELEGGWHDRNNIKLK